MGRVSPPDPPREGPLEPSRFRSPLLEALPPVPPDRDRRTLHRRRLGLFLAAAAFVVPAVVAGSRRLSAEGPGYVLYWLHDRIYLPLKGYFLTWFFPTSWIYLLSGLTLLLFGLVAVAWKRPLTPSWQVLVGRRLLARPSLRSVLALWGRAAARARRRFGSVARRTGGWPWIGRLSAAVAESLDGPTLLEELVEHEREAALERLDGLDPAAGESVAALAEAVGLALFSRRLAPADPRSDRSVVEALGRLGEALLRLELVRFSRGGEPEPSIEELRGRLEAEISLAVGPLLPARPRRPDFSLAALAQDLALVLELEAPRGWPPELLENRRERVLEGVESRRRSLDECRRHVERWTAYSSRRRGSPTLPDLRFPGSRLGTRLATDVALLAALRFGAARDALGFLEGLEGLRFTLLAAGGTESEAEALLTALDGLPRPVDYRISARLLGRETAEALDVAEALSRRSEVVTQADLGLISARRADLATAAADPGGSRLSARGNPPSIPGSATRPDRWRKPPCP